MRFKIFVSLLLSTFLIGSAIAQNTNYPPSPIPDRIVLSWSKDPATTQSVNWRTDTSVTEAFAEIALADASPDFVKTKKPHKAKTEVLLTNDHKAHYHSVIFRHLIPGKMYVYRVGSEAGWSEWFQFETAEQVAAPFSFAYFGDAQNDLKSFWSRCVRQAYSTMPDMDFMIHAGDLINRANRDAEWGEWFYAAGWITGTKAQMACPGNHEYIRSETGERVLDEHWGPTFTFPENGPEDLKESTYYFDYQGVRFIALNTQAMLSYPEQLILQKEWLERVLSTNPHKWTIVFQHHPIYSTAQGRDNPELEKFIQPIFEKYGVDLVLQGHDHTYGRGHNLAFGENRKPKKKDKLDKGPVYVVSVSGPKMYNLNFSDWLSRAASNTQLFQLIHIKGDYLRFEAYTTTGKLYDAFELIKRPGGFNLFVDKAPEDQPELISIPRRYERNMTEEQLEAYKKKFEAYKRKKEMNKG